MSAEVKQPYTGQRTERGIGIDGGRRGEKCGEEAAGSLTRLVYCFPAPNCRVRLRVLSSHCFCSSNEETQTKSSKSAEL